MNHSLVHKNSIPMYMLLLQLKSRWRQGLNSTNKFIFRKKFKCSWLGWKLYGMKKEGVRYDMISTTYLLVFTSQYKEIPEAIKRMILNIDQISSISIINHIRRGLYIPSNAVSPLTSHTFFFIHSSSGQPNFFNQLHLNS